jgi:hypothetical protein
MYAVIIREYEKDQTVLIYTVLATLSYKCLYEIDAPMSIRAPGDRRENSISKGMAEYLIFHVIISNYEK